MKEGTNEYINSLAQSLYEANQDPWVQLMCERREEAIREEEARLAKIAEQEKIIFEQTQMLSEKDRIIEDLQKQLAQRE